MRRLRSLLVLMLVPLALGLVLTQLAGAEASANPKRAAEPESAAAQAELGASAPAIRNTLRISIPYGFDTPLPVLGGGREVVASGHGGCTAGEEATVAITVTQAASGAVATGEDQHTCTGVLHLWDAVVTLDTPDSFVAGPAEACGFAVTRAGGYVTDTYAWCKDVDLLRLDLRSYLPLLFGP